MQSIGWMRAAAFALAWQAGAACAQNASPQGGAMQPADVQKLADCFVSNSGEGEYGAMRKVMIAALSDDTAGLKTALADFSGLLLKLALGPCQVGMSQLQNPAYQAGFKEASSRYGAVLGQKLIQDAFAKLN